MKFLLFLALLAVVWWIWRKKRPRPSVDMSKTQHMERMVACSYCQVHLPESESIRVGALHYCSKAHQQAGEASHSS
jgi:uncharacterized protein